MKNRISFNQFRKLVKEASAVATDGEASIIDEIFKSLNNDNYLLEFSDNGNEIFLTDTRDDSCYTITVRRDK